jgi:hypothetical protein
MRQGHADKSGPSSRKVEPKSTAVNPAAADQLGQAVGSRLAAEQLFEGHGYSAPKGAGHQVHKCGSQGRH